MIVRWILVTWPDGQVVVRRYASTADAVAAARGFKQMVRLGACRTFTTGGFVLDFPKASG